MRVRAISRTLSLQRVESDYEATSFGIHFEERVFMPFTAYALIKNLHSLSNELRFQSFILRKIRPRDPSLKRKSEAAPI
jgi:hypothetical protein